MIWSLKLRRQLRCRLQCTRQAAGCYAIVSREDKIPLMWAGRVEWSDHYICHERVFACIRIAYLVACVCRRV